jgi:hypothetical protein
MELREICARITRYLAGGGLFNPEMANHDAVRDMLIDFRRELESAIPAYERAIEALRYCQGVHTPAQIRHVVDEALAPFTPVAPEQFASRSQERRIKAQRKPVAQRSEDAEG